jgi:hypothetical protein
MDTKTCPGCERNVVPLGAGQREGTEPNVAECPDCGFLGYTWEWEGDVAPVLRAAAEALKAQVRKEPDPWVRIAMLNDPQYPLNARLLATIELGRERG